MTSVVAWRVLMERLAAFENRVPDAEEYQELCNVVTEHPMVASISRLDPFSSEYRQAVMELYFDLRGRDVTDYDAARDERSNSDAADIWSGISPWNFRDMRFISEFLFSWAHVMQLLDVKPGDRVIEYGPGSGQLLLMLARSGIKTFGVDIDEPSLACIRAQAAAMKLDVSLERDEFGEGFDGEVFDRVIFFEAFHHALHFDVLLRRLRGRVRPGGKILLCGEPIVGHFIPSVPYAWGPRLDALSVFCIRRHGWMELGFTQDFLVEAFRREGWELVAHPFPTCGRATAYVASRLADVPDPLIATLKAEMHVAEQTQARLEAERNEALAAVAALRTSTSWRITRPLRLLSTASSRLRQRPTRGSSS